MTELMLRLGRHDERLLLALVARRRRWLDTGMRAITHLGGASITVALALGLIVAGSAELAEAGARGAFALAASHLGVQLLKRGVHRPRPRPRLDAGLVWLVRAPDRFSFPSGHAAAALSMGLAVAACLPPVAAALVVALALTVGVSRCYLGVHYPGDVAAGWSLAALGLLAADPALSLLGLG